MTFAGSLCSFAHAQEVALDMTGCAQPSASDVRAVLAVELHEQLLPEGEPLPPGARVVEVRCNSSDARLWLKGTNTRRTIALTSVPRELRARLLALSVAELTRPQLARPQSARPQPTASGAPAAGPATRGADATRAAAATPKAGAARPARASRSDDAARSDDVRSDDVRSDDAARSDGARSNGARSEGDERSADATEEDDSANEDDEEEPEAYDSNTTDLRPPPTYFAWLGAEAHATPLFGVGGSLAFQAIVSEWLAWSSAVSVAHASTNIDRGDLSVLSLSVRTGLALALRSPRASLHLGVGLRGQWQRLEGEPSNAELTRPSSFSAWSLGPAAFGGATWQFAAPAFLALELEAARLREVKAEVEAAGAKTLSAWRATAVLGVGLAW